MDSAEEVARVLAEIRDEVKRNGEEVAKLRQELAGVEVAKNQRVLPFAPPAPEDQLVTLDQMAATVHVSKRSLERHRKTMPAPAMKGRKGRASRWRWSDVRPWLEAAFGCALPERFPTW